MSDKLIIKEILEKDDPALDEVKQMFQSMYEVDDPGQAIQLAEGGAEIWLQGVRKGLGRFGMICVASLDDENIGFAHGSLRILPDFYDGQKIGYISHIFVDEKVRKKGVGEGLVRKLEEWFADKEVHSVELQVLINNDSGKAFWERMGYPSELLQCRKMGNKL